MYFGTKYDVLLSSLEMHPSPMAQNKPPIGSHFFSLVVSLRIIRAHVTYIPIKSKSSCEGLGTCILDMFLLIS